MHQPIAKDDSFTYIIINSYIRINGITVANIWMYENRFFDILPGSADHGFRWDMLQSATILKPGLQAIRGTRLKSVQVLNHTDIITKINYSNNKFVPAKAGIDSCALV